MKTFYSALFVSWKVFLPRNEDLVYFAAASSVQSPCLKEKCYFLFTAPFQNLHLLCWNIFPLYCFNRSGPSPGFFHSMVCFQSYFIEIFSTSENIVLLAIACLFSKQNNIWRYTSIFPFKVLCHVEVIQGLVYNKKLQCGNIFSILLSVYNKRTPIFLEHLRVSPILGHVVLKLPVFQTPIIKWKENFAFHRMSFGGKNSTLAFFSQYWRNW